MHPLWPLLFSLILEAAASQNIFSLRHEESLCRTELNRARLLNPAAPVLSEKCRRLLNLTETTESLLKESQTVVNQTNSQPTNSLFKASLDANSLEKLKILNSSTENLLQQLAVKCVLTDLSRESHLVQQSCKQLVRTLLNIHDRGHQQVGRLRRWRGHRRRYRGRGRGSRRRLQRRGPRRRHRRRGASRRRRRHNLRPRHRRSRHFPKRRGVKLVYFRRPKRRFQPNSKYYRKQWIGNKIRKTKNKIKNLQPKNYKMPHKSVHQAVEYKSKNEIKNSNLEHEDSYGSLEGKLPQYTAGKSFHKKVLRKYAHPARRTARYLTNKYSGNQKYQENSSNGHQSYKQETKVHTNAVGSASGSQHFQVEDVNQRVSDVV